MIEERFIVKGMSCAHCKKAIESALKDVDAVINVQVGLGKELVKVEFDENKVDLDTLKDQVRAAGYEVE